MTGGSKMAARISSANLCLSSRVACPVERALERPSSRARIRPDVLDLALDGGSSGAHTKCESPYALATGAIHWPTGVKTVPLAAVLPAGAAASRRGSTSPPE